MRVRGPDIVAGTPIRCHENLACGCRRKRWELELSHSNAFDTLDSTPPQGRSAGYDETTF
jgi:hypothetical protein